MVLYPGFTFSFITFPLSIPSDNVDFIHRIIPSVSLLILITLSFIIHRNLRFLRGSISGEKLNLPADQLCRRFTFAEIRTATRKFSDGFVIGKGGFGKVFKGIIDNGATTVAVKRLDPMSKQGGKEFLTEIEMLSKFRHSHVVSLIGYCHNNDEMILVYEYVENGSLADHLYKEKATNANNSTMSWVKRVKICLGAARGLDYLHTGTGFLQRVIHRDVKSSNILLDENWAAKISDFGLSKISPANQSLTHISTGVKGTPGYCDPEYFLTRRLTRKSDVYSFGVVLFEVLCGRPVFDSRLPKEQRSLVLWAKQCIQDDKIHLLIDPKMEWEIFDNSLKAFVKISGQCLDSRPKKRPTMSEVVASLEVALALQEKKDFSSLDEDSFDFGEPTFDNQDEAASSILQAGFIYTDSSNSTLLMPLSHYLPTGQGEGNEITFLGEVTSTEDTLRGAASQTSSNITYEEHINGNVVYLPPVIEEESSSFALEEEGPGIEGLQIEGEAKLGGTLTACGYFIRGTTTCMFQWVHYLGDHSKKYIEATLPEYIVILDDVGKFLALECMPMDDRGRLGKVVTVMANDQIGITCEPHMQQEIDRYISEGKASFLVLLLAGSRYKEGEPTNLFLEKLSYHFKIYTPKAIVIAEIFSKGTSIKIPLGSSTLFDITSSNGSSHSFKTYNDDGTRDTLVLTMRALIAKALDEKRKGKA